VTSRFQSQPRAARITKRNKRPNRGPFDGSRQVNCRRLLRGWDVDGVSRFLLPAGVQCLHDDCVIVIVNQRDTGGVLLTGTIAIPKAAPGTLSIESCPIN
jgi:hypothetical protein